MSSQSSNNSSATYGSLSVSQTLSLPIGQNLGNALTRTLVPTSGSIAFDSTNQSLYFGTTTVWLRLALDV